MCCSFFLLSLSFIHISRSLRFICFHYWQCSLFLWPQPQRCIKLTMTNTFNKKKIHIFIFMLLIILSVFHIEAVTTCCTIESENNKFQLIHMRRVMLHWLMFTAYIASFCNSCTELRKKKLWCNANVWKEWISVIFGRRMLSKIFVASWKNFINQGNSIFLL